MKRIFILMANGEPLAAFKDENQLGGYILKGGLPHLSAEEARELWENETSPCGIYNYWEVGIHHIPNL